MTVAKATNKTKFNDMGTVFFSHTVSNMLIGKFSHRFQAALIKASCRKSRPVIYDYTDVISWKYGDEHNEEVHILYGRNHSFG